MVSKTLSLILAALLGLAFSAATAPRVACSTTIIGDVVREIGGDRIELHVLMGPNADPHAFEPTPQDAVMLDRASLVFINGADLEASLDPLLAANSATIVDLSAKITLRTLGGGTVTGASPQDAAQVDPHVWFDPENVAIWADEIATALAAVDPDHATAYRAAADDYRSALDDLDRWIVDRVDVIPPDQRVLVTDHETFGYFAARYGFTQIGSVFPGLSTLSEPSARDLAQLESAVRAHNVPALFVGTSVNPALAEQVANDTGIRVLFLYTGALSGPDGPAPTYIDLMRYDVNQIVKGLTGTPP